MAESPNDPDRPAGKPKYLPRLTYKPPDPDPEDEEGEELDEDGNPIPAAKAKTKPKADGSPSPPPAKKKREPSPIDPPRAGYPMRAGADLGEKPKARPKDTEGGKGKAKSAPKESGKERTGALIEATPEGETYDARRRGRMLIGGIAGGIVLLSLFVVWRSLKSDEPVDDFEPGTPEVAVAAQPVKKISPAAQEAAAKKLLADARSYQIQGNIDEAVKRVDRVIREYPEAPSAKLALDASERHRQGLPLFVQGAAVVATKTETKDPEPPAEGDPEPVAAAPAPGAENTEPAATPLPPGPATVEVVPAVPGAIAPNRALAEPRRLTGVGLPKADVAARPLPPGFHVREEAGVHLSGWPLEITCDRDGGTMVLVPADSFNQGRDDGRAEERPAHRVQLSSYYIDQHEVTARQFALFKGGPADADDRPAVSVSLDDALTYCRWAGKTVPTEAQWEMAARTPDSRFHPWGNSAPEWERTRNPKQIDPVMSFASDLSPYGVFDLAGNAWEWTNDWFDAKYYVAMKGRVVVNPSGPPKGKGRLPEVVIKGGSKDYDSAWRSGMRPDARLPYLGFRGVLNVEGGGGPAPGPGVPNGPVAAPNGTVPF